MAPGLCAFVGGRPKVSPVLKLFSFLHDKSEVPASIQFLKQSEVIEHSHCQLHEETAAEAQQQQPLNTDETQCGENACILEDLAYARSGDKGNSANIGVVARHPDFVPYIRKHVTSDVVHDYFSCLFEESATDEAAVTRYELEGIDGFNFYLRDCLGGGGVASLRTDPQGKAFGQMLLDLKVEGLPDDVIVLIDELKKRKKCC